jgi:DNA helicase IV
MPETDPVIAVEAAHLAASRVSLRAMRDDTLALRPLGGNAVSDEILADVFRKRAAALRDDPRIPLFFGRLDYDVGEFAHEHFYVGRRHVHDAAGEPMVVDWRAPVSEPFYQANRQDSMGLDLRRRFGFAAGDLTAYEDETFAGSGPDGPLITSQIMTDEIERPRTGPMRDIVATIQPEQDEIVRTDLSVSVCVQGAPGTGKTAVGLHRVAYLLYTYRERLRRGGALVIGPNREFLRYIEQVLPALGEVDVAQATLAELVAHVPIRGEDDATAARVKGEARMAEVLRRALWARPRPAGEALPDGVLVPRGSRRWRVSAYELDGLVESVRERDVRYGAGRAMLAQRIAHTVLSRMEAAGEAPDDRVQDAVARSRPVKLAVDALWPAVDAVRLVFGLLSNPDILAAAADGLLDADEQTAIRFVRPTRTPGAARWTVADAVLIDEARDLIERTPSLTHVVLDEAQDLSAMQCRAVGRRCSTGSVTVLGDIAQGTTPWATDSWASTLGHLGKPDALLEELTLGFRVPRQIIDFAARLLPAAAPGLEPPSSVRQAAGALELLPNGDIAAECRAALALEGSVGVVAADSRVRELSQSLAAASIAHAVLGVDETEDSRLWVLPATLAKGLEYDQVLVVEPAEIVAAEPQLLHGLRRLYVVLTRAVSRLVVIHDKPLPDALVG